VNQPRAATLRLYDSLRRRSISSRGSANLEQSATTRRLLVIFANLQTPHQDSSCLMKFSRHINRFATLHKHFLTCPCIPLGFYVMQISSLTLVLSTLFLHLTSVNGRGGFSPPRGKSGIYSDLKDISLCDFLCSKEK